MSMKVFVILETLHAFSPTAMKLAVS